MGIKTNDKKVNIENAIKRNKDKFLKPLINDEESIDDSDAYFSVVKSRAKKENKNTEQSGNFFLSPMRGRVIDRSTYRVTSSRGNIEKQYDFLRKEKKLKKDDLKEQFGHEYYEFNVINNQKKQENLSKQEETPLSKESPQTPISPNPYKEQEPIYKEMVREPEKVNIIYEEEIELDDDNNIITSYDENSRQSFFSDYETIQNTSNDDNTYTNVNIYEKADKRKGLREELKKLFAEEDYSPKDEVYYEENITFDKPTKPIVEEFKEKPVNSFINIKKELDNEINKRISTQTKTINDLSQYQFPPLDLLNESEDEESEDLDWIRQQMDIIDSTLESFTIAAKTVNYSIGPSVIRYEIEPDPGTKVSRITALQDDIKLRLAASDIRMEAPISGKSTVGVEVPKKKKRLVTLREILESPSYKALNSPLKIALGLDITGEAIFSDIGSMTHSLIAGSTGSGKSVCINCIIMSILYNALPDEVKLVLIDPKKVEFSVYRDIPHLLTPVVNDTKVATATLKWLTEEMDRRYELIENVGARDIKTYNNKRNYSSEDLPKLPYIVVIIDELADLMLVAANEVEDYIQRISQLARAAGIHLIVATQRPSTNVITGTIKTNIPTRISFQVASSIDSRIILDEGGAEKLLGKGDMLLSDNGKPQLKRLQGSYVNDEEIEKVTYFVKEQMAPNYVFTADEIAKKENDYDEDIDDDLFDDAVRFIIELGEASASKIQRKFKVGYNRAARMIDLMEKYQIIGPQQNGSKPREVLMTLSEYERLF